jgi:hypothetical protein
MLFSRSDIRIESEPQGASQPTGASVPGEVRFALGRKRADLDALIGDLRPDEHIHIPSLGSWSMHDVLAFLLRITGPADVWITSWTITEEPVRLLLEHPQPQGAFPAQLHAKVALGDLERRKTEQDYIADLNKARRVA